MALEVFSESISKYARSPNVADDYLAHYGVKGQRWNHHDMKRKWQNQARYAIGDQRHTDGTPITYSGKKELRETLMGKSGKTPRDDFSTLSDEEIQTRINRLTKENNLLKQLQDQRKYDQYFINETKKAGVLSTLGKKLAGASGVAGKRIATAGGYKIAESLLGEETAKMMFYNEKPKSDKQKKKEEAKQEKNKPYNAVDDYYKQLRGMEEDLSRYRNGNLAYDKAFAKWQKENPDEPFPLKREDYVKGVKGSGSDGSAKGNKGSKSTAPEAVRETTSKSMKDPAIQKLFDLYDDDNNGLLDMKELQDAFYKDKNDLKELFNLPVSSTSSSTSFYDLYDDPSEWYHSIFKTDNK